MPTKCVIALLVLIASSDALGQAPPGHQSNEYFSPTVREEQKVTVDGIEETWRLIWSSAPKPHCDTSDEASLTCPCMGFAYGETGDLFLIRIREGKEIDRLHLTPLFTESEEAVLQRWPVNYDKDVKAFDDSDFLAKVKHRPVVRIMRPADYDHDGWNTEFYLQTETAPCGKGEGVVIGLSKKNPRLHAFGTASDPTKPLYLQEREWEALRDASGPVEAMDWACFDHGADAQTTVLLRWNANGIDGRRRVFSCPESPDKKDEHPRLLRESPLSTE
jgi:hypothetical protein